MKKLLLIFILLCVNIFGNENNKSLNIGMISSSEVFLSVKNATESVRKWILEVAKKNKMDLDINFYENDEKEYEDYKSGKLNIVFLELDFFEKHIEEILKTSNDFWTISSMGEEKNHYCLVVNSSINFNSFKDIKAKKVALLKSNIISNIWLDKKSLELNNKRAKDLLSQTMYLDKDTKVLLNVYFKKSDIGVLKKSTWDTMLELNPAISKKVKLFECSSYPIPIFIGVIKNNVDKKSRREFLNLISNGGKNDDSKEILRMLGIDHFYSLSDKDIEEIRTFFKRYRLLKGKSK